MQRRGEHDYSKIMGQFVGILICTTKVYNDMGINWKPYCFLWASFNEPLTFFRGSHEFLLLFQSKSGRFFSCVANIYSQLHLRPTYRVTHPHLLPRSSGLASDNAKGLKSLFWSKLAKEWLTNLWVASSARTALITSRRDELAGNLQ